MSLITSIIESKYDYLWKSIIRPPRDLYESSELGREKFSINNLNYKRTDFNLRNERKLKLECSIWEPFDEERICERLPLLIYLPGNSSSRCEALPLLQYLLPLNICVLAFDFSGSGRSEGEYISLGFYEKDDVKCVVDHVKKLNKNSTIGIWGRSMGAVTALMYSSKYNSTKDIKSQYKIDCLVLDSAFSNLQTLMDEAVEKIVYLPKIIVDLLKNKVSEIILDKAGFHIEDINPELASYEIKTVPALFLHALNDTFINKNHTEKLYNAYNGEKQIIMFDGDHNSKRPVHVLQMISLFFYDKLKCENVKEMSDDFDLREKITAKEDINASVNIKKTMTVDYLNTINSTSNSFVTEKMMAEEEERDLDFDVCHRERDMKAMRSVNNKECKTDNDKSGNKTVNYGVLNKSYCNILSKKNCDINDMKKRKDNINDKFYNHNIINLNNSNKNNNIIVNKLNNTNNNNNNNINSININNTIHNNYIFMNSRNVLNKKKGTLTACHFKNKNVKINFDIRKKDNKNKYENYMDTNKEIDDLILDIENNSEKPKTINVHCNKIRHKKCSKYFQAVKSM